MYLKIKQVSDITALSIRMLHHYDKIGLLVPAKINNAGYRFYSKSDIDKIHQIVFFKELDFSLAEISKIINHPGFDNDAALQSQKELLIKKKTRLENIINSIEDIIKGGDKMNNKEKFKAFDSSEIEEYKKKYAQEVKEKYGHTDAYKESNQKTAKYSKKDWSIIMETSNNIYRELSNLMDNSPSDSEVQILVEKLNEHISNSFYNCTPEIFRGLADMYITDERFTKFFEKFNVGFAVFLNKAIIYYCDNM